jgi:hypothetical protein
MPNVSGDVVVTETYRYLDTSGHPSERDTVVRNGSTVLQSFEQTFSRDPLGVVTAPGYPVCQSPVNCPVPSLPTVTNVYTNGMLSNVSGVASLDYNNNGTLGTVTHTNNVTDTIAQDPNLMPRPQSVEFDGFCSTSASIVNAPLAICAGTNATATASPSTGATYLWTIDNGSIVSGATSATVTFTAPAGTAVLHLKVTTCADAFAQTSIVVTTSASISQQPLGTTINSGSSTQLSVGVNASNPHFQWYQGTPSTGTLLTGQTGSTFTTPTLTQTTTYWVRVTSDCGTVDSNGATVTVVTIGPPTNMTAQTQDPTTGVQVHWSLDPNASSYIVEYATNVAGPFTQLGQPTTAPLAFYIFPSYSTPVALVFRVWSTNSNGVRVAVSNMDYAVVASTLFTDEQIQKGITRVKGAHIKELRDAIDALRAAASTAQNPLPPIWANAPPPSGLDTAINMTTLFAPFNAARSVFGMSAFAYGQGVSSPVSGGRIVSDHIQQLRNALR